MGRRAAAVLRSARDTVLILDDHPGDLTHIGGTCGTLAVLAVIHDKAGLFARLFRGGWRGPSGRSSLLDPPEPDGRV